MNTQIQTTYAAKIRSLTPKQKIEFNINLLEMRHPETEIRQMYAKWLAGRGNYTSINDIPTKCIRKAFATDYDEVVNRVAKIWDSFKTKK